jgi:adenylylsulfate kinase-like enzyme
MKRKLQSLFLVCFVFFLNLSSAETFICPPIDEQREPKLDIQSIKIIEKCIRNSPSTKSLYFNRETKKYTVERQQLHDKIINEIFQNKPCKTKNPIAILTGGLPGSGKTTYLRKEIPSYSLKNFVIIDADAIREKLPEYKGWNATNTQPELRDIIQQILAKIADNCPYNLVYDSSMSNLKFFKEFIKNLKVMNYEIYIVYLEISIKNAEKRAQDRYLSSGRYVPYEFLNRVDSQGKKTFNSIKDEVDGYIMVDAETKKVIQEGGKSIPGF